MPLDDLVAAAIAVATRERHDSVEATGFEPTTPCLQSTIRTTGRSGTETVFAGQVVFVVAVQ